MADTGIKNINAAFDRLERAVQLRILRSALNTSLTPLVKELRKAAPVGSKAHKSYKGTILPPGYLSRKGIIKSSRLTKDKKAATANVKLRDEAWYGSMIEHGWRPGKRSADVKRASKRKAGRGGLSDSDLDALGDRRSKIPAKPWFNPAVKRMEKEVEEAYFQKIESRVLKAWRK